MKHFKYLIIGGGLAGDAATKGIRELDPDGTIGMSSMEPDPTYMRPNLSKGLWKGRPVEKIWRKTQERATELHLSCKVTQIEPEKNWSTIWTMGSIHTTSCCLPPAVRPTICHAGKEILFTFALSRIINSCAN